MQLFKNFIKKRKTKKINKLSNKIHKLMKMGYYGTNMYHELEFRRKEIT